jgi:hypothetical protein
MRIDDWSAEETDDPGYADGRNFYKSRSGAETGNPECYLRERSLY